jgi:exodeoxyribonuclease-3
MKVVTFNTNSIRTRLELVLHWMQRETPNVICFQETKVQDADFPAAAFKEIGYHVVFCGQKAYAGVAIASREECQEVTCGFDDGGEPDEPRLIRAVVQGIPIVNTYVPQGRSADSPHFQYKLEWFARLWALFKKRYSPQKPLLWMGDFNVAPEPIDVYDPRRLKDHVDFHPDACAALERVRGWGFVDIFRLYHPQEEEQYTFWDYRVANAVERKVGWRVDHIWATEPLARKSTRTWIDVEARQAERPSDHTFLIAEFAL